jgi:predicted O-methyltransferase YrrM
MITPLEINLDDSHVFDRYVNRARGVEGFFNLESAAIWDFLLKLHDGMGVSGDMLEVGVLNGRSLLLSLASCREGERHVAVDRRQLDGLVSVMEGLTPDERRRLVFHKGNSTDVALMGAAAGPFRWIHIDADHAHDAVLADLDAWVPKLQDCGLLVLDDFYNFRHAEVTDALYHYLYTRPHHLAPLCIGYNKAYLTTQRAHEALFPLLRDHLTEYVARRDKDVESYTCRLYGYLCMCLRRKL